jgi:hypothetical protein
MDLHVGIGVSDDLDEPGEAVAAAVEVATRGLDGAPAVAAIVFASIDFDQETLMGELRARLGEIPMVGCTTDGEINSFGTYQDSISIMLLGGEGLSACTAVAEQVSMRAAAGPGRPRRRSWRG